MKPAAVRKTITTALALRVAWSGITMFRYPPGDLAEWKNGFTLGDISGVTNEDLDLSGENHRVSYEMAGGLWVAIDGAKDDDFETVETAAIALVNDFQTWIVTVNHGKTLTVTGTVIDYLDLDTWDLTFTPKPAAAVVEFTLAVVEVD